MADEKRKVRVEERLKIKIGEAKNIPSRSHGSLNERDVYCALSLDQEEIFRTSTINRTLNPFFGEEFQFSVPRKFRYLSVYVNDRDKTDKVIGKVAIRREELQAYHNTDHWFQIKPVNEHTEVQGKVNLEARFENSLDISTERLTVVVKECSDLTLCYGACDPYATIAVRFTSGKTETRRTKVRKKTNSPVFNESFTFELSNGARGSDNSYCVAAQGGNWCELVVTLHHESSGSNVFLGEVRVNLQQLQNNELNAWYLLQPGKRNVKSKVTPVNTDMGSLRLKIHYTRDYVFDSTLYRDLRELILESASAQPITSSACFLLGEIIPNKLDAAQPLVRLLLHHGQIVPIIRALATWEISKTTDPNTIFRGNTLVSKMMDETMRLAGLHYLHETLKPSLETVINGRKPCEIDPSKISDINTLQANLANLKDYVENIFQAITSSAPRCPPILCEVFHELREIASTYFPDNREVRYSVISGFIFLRFFAPAILGPRLFDLTSVHIDSQVNRTLTLISKTIQSLCNVVTSRSSAFKEQYMGSMYQAFFTPSHITAVRQFLDIISATATPSSGSSDCPVILKEGILTKRAQGRKRFGRKNFKQRYFRLTTQDLSYSKHKGKDPLCTISVSNIVGVERLQDDSFRKSNMFQIMQPQGVVLYVQASNCVEAKEWVDMLVKMCYMNNHRLQNYHPGAYTNGHWQCCNSTSDLAEGCSDVSSHLQIRMDVDAERELARIHSLIFQHMDRLLSVKNWCEARSQRSDLNPTSCVVEDRASTQQTLVKLGNAANNLQRETKRYLRTLALETKYGSKQAPIGDDNYLMLTSRLDTGSLRNYHL